MGRQKGDGNRSKTRPSSSSAAASLLQNTNALSVGFGGYVGSSRVDTSDNQEKDIQVDVDGEAALHFRRLSKKDSTTRVKALKALIEIFKERPVDELCQLLPKWIFEYKKLVQDDNPQVREGTHNAMSAIAVSVGRGLAPHLRMVMGAWWVSQFDPVRDVSTAAQQSFQAAFQGPAKRLEALAFCASDVLMHMDGLLKLSPQTISEKSIPIEESTKRYELVISSALLALAAFLDVTLQSKNSTFLCGNEPNKVDTEFLNEKKHLERRNEVENLAAKLCLSHKHFRDFVKSKSSQIRCASYQALRSFAQNVAAVFSAQDLDSVGGVVLGSFSDKDPSCHAAMWDMVLCISRLYPQAWNVNATKKFVLPRLFSFLRHATYGSCKVSYPCILPLLSLLPLNTTKPVTEFFKELFVSLWDGHSVCHMALEDEIILLNTLQECFLWIINNAIRFADYESIALESIHNFMMENVLLEILWKGYAFAGSQFAVNSLSRDVSVNEGDGLAKGTFETRRKLGKESYSSQFLEKLRICITDVLINLSGKNKNSMYVFWKHFQVVCFEAVLDEEKHSADSVTTGFVFRLSEFLSELGTQLSSDNSWLLTQAVRPLVAKLYPMVKATGFCEAIQLLAKLVSIYGPFSFPVYEFFQRGKGREEELITNEYSKFEVENKELSSLLTFLKDELTPWSLEPSNFCQTEKINLLLSFFEDRRFVGEWNTVLSYALRVEDTESGSNQINCGKVTVLAVLIENFRIKFFDSNKIENCGKGESQSPKRWDLSGLDRLAVEVAGSVLLSDHSSLHLLRHVLGGSIQLNLPSLVPKECVEKVFGLLLQRMLYALLKSEKDWAKFAASCVLQPDKKLPLAAVEDERAVALACSAAQVVCGSFCSLEHLNNLEVAFKAVAALYCIYWAYGFLSKEGHKTPYTFESEQKSTTDNYAGSSSDSEDDENLPHLDVSLMPVDPLVELKHMVTNVSLVLNSGVCRNLTSAIRIHVQRRLIYCVRHAVVEGTSDIVRAASACGKWVLAMMDQLCINVQESQQVLDMLLEPTNAWPLFTMRPEKAENLALSVEKPWGLSVQEPRHIRFAAFIDKVGSFIGWEKLVVRSWPLSLESNLSITSGKSIKLDENLRVWLVIEMLCTWCWPGGRAVNTVLPFLVSSTNEEEGKVKSAIVNNVIVSLFTSTNSRKKALQFNNKYWMGSNEDMENVEDSCLRALLVVLRNILKESRRAHHAEVFYKMLVIDQGFLEESLTYERSKVLPFILSVLVPILRKQQEKDPLFLSSIPLEEAVCKWLALASSTPPLSSHSNFISDLEHTLQVIAACFPLHAAGGSVAVMAAASAQISSQERALLLSLMQKESSESIGFVSYVAKQHAMPRESSLAVKNARLLHEEILARLVAASVAYCWKDFQSQDWIVVTNHMRKWLEAAVLEAENITQLSIDTVKAVEKETSKELQSCAIVDKIHKDIQRASSTESDLSWTAVVLFSLLQAIEKSTFEGSADSQQILESIRWGESKHRALSYILRIFFASGMAESFVLDSAAGEVAGSIIASSRGSDLGFWEIVSEIVLGISSEERVEIARHLNIWTVGKDAARALYALLFSSEPIGGLQHASYSLLTSAPFQTSAVTYEDSLLQEDRLEVEAIHLELPSLNSINLRRELAAVLETSPSRVVESALDSPVRVQYLLAWGIFLSHLRSISVSSPAGERLVQYVQDTSISATLLDSIFQHIPLKQETGPSIRKKSSTAYWQAQLDRVGDAARRACTLGSVSLAVEALWPLEEETVSSLAAGLYGMLLQVLPACVRVWFTGLRDRSASSSVESFTAKFCSPHLLAEEFLQVYSSTIADDSLTIKANSSIGEVIVVYKKEEAGMDMLIRLPKCYPLRAVDIDCTRRLGISETRLRKWMLSMASFLRNQNGAVAEAIQIWKQNVDQEFEGVEECPICYSIIHTSNHSLPRLACRTCKHKFHAACLYKWFSTSHKSTCPLCQTPF